MTLVKRKETQRVINQCTTTKEIITTKALAKINLHKWIANINLKTRAQFFSLNRGYTYGCSNTSEQITKISKMAKIKSSPTIIKSVHYILSPPHISSGCFNKLTYKNTCPISFLPAHLQNGQCPSTFWNPVNRSLLRPRSSSSMGWQFISYSHFYGPAELHLGVGRLELLPC